MTNFTNDDGLKVSLQDTALGLVMDFWDIFDNPKEVFLCNDFSCVETVINNIPSIVVIKAAMVPGDPYFSDEALELIPEITDYVYKEILKENDSYDIYYMGARLMQTRVPEDEQGVFRIGGKYSGQNSPVKLIKRCKAHDYGFTAETPYKMSEVSDEYYFLKNLKCNFGEIVGYDRDGSFSGPNGGILDVWSLFVEINDRRYEYKIYMDPYAFKVFENPFENNKDLYGFSFTKQ